MTDIAMVGSGHVGLVTGACLADTGHRVTCVDVDEAKVAAVKAGRAPIHEPGLEELLRANIGGSLRAGTDLVAAVVDSDVSFIAVGTPTKGDRQDLRFVEAAARSIGEGLRRRDGYHVVVVKSTVLPGTTKDVVLPILEDVSGKKAGPDFGVGMNPEFLTEGVAVEEFMSPDRIVLGGIDRRSIEAMEEVYRPFVGTPVVRTTTGTAEMIKYASNALLAAAISFSNEMANLCASLDGVDVVDVMRGVHLSRYLSPSLPGGPRMTAPLSSFLEAGCGFGGSCLPKDVRALVELGSTMGRSTPLLDAVLEVNDGRADEVLRLLQRRLPELAGVRVAVLGLAFKPDTDDVRESPAIAIVNRLLGEGASVTVCDPVASDAVETLFPVGSVAGTDDLAEAVVGAAAAVVVTRWRQFGALADLVARLDPAPLVVDARRMLDPHAFESYEGIGVHRPDMPSPAGAGPTAP